MPPLVTDSFIAMVDRSLVKESFKPVTQCRQVFFGSRYLFLLVRFSSYLIYSFLINLSDSLLLKKFTKPYRAFPLLITLMFSRGVPQFSPLPPDSLV